MQVRRASAEDARAIATVDVASWRAAYGDIMPAAYLDALDVTQKTAGWSRAAKRDESRGKRTLVVEAEQSIVGFAVVGPDDEPAFGLLWLMYVHPAYWGKGAASPLMQHSLDELRGLGYIAARLWVLEANTRARCFYERGGWTSDGATGVATHGDVNLATLRYERAL